MVFTKVADFEGVKPAMLIEVIPQSELRAPPRFTFGWASLTTPGYVWLCLARGAHGVNYRSSRVSALNPPGHGWHGGGRLSVG